MKLRTVYPIAMGVVTITVVGLVLTGHTAWIPSPAAADLLASKSICIAVGRNRLDQRSVQTNGHWSRLTSEGTVATGDLWRRDRKALEAAARESPPPPRSSTAQACSDSTGDVVTYRWRYNGQVVAVSQKMYAASALPIQLELDRLAYKLD